MDIAIALAQIQEKPSAFLSSECALALEAFLFGYKSADQSVAIILRELATEFEGPEQAGACTLAYLASPDSITSFRRVMAAAEVVLRRVGTPTPVPGPCAEMTLVTVVDDAILQGRPAMVLAEPTVVWMHDFFRGFLVGLSAVRPAAALRQERRLMAFESWLRASYGGASAAPWYGIIRVYEGMCERGLKRFLELWAEFERECPDMAS